MSRDSVTRGFDLLICQAVQRLLEFSRKAGTVFLLVSGMILQCFFASQIWVHMFCPQKL